MGRYTKVGEQHMQTHGSKGKQDQSVRSALQVTMTGWADAVQLEAESVTLWELKRYIGGREWRATRIPTS